MFNDCGAEPAGMLCSLLIRQLSLVDNFIACTPFMFATLVSSNYSQAVRSPLSPYCLHTFKISFKIRIYHKYIRHVFNGGQRRIKTIFPCKSGSRRMIISISMSLSVCYFLFNFIVFKY